MEINGTLSAIVTGGASGLGEATARVIIHGCKGGYF